MRFLVKDMDISTGSVSIVILNKKDTALYDLHPGDRILITVGKRKTVAVLDIAESHKAVRPGSIGLFEETLRALNIKSGARIIATLAPKPLATSLIRKKLDGSTLSYKEYYTIIEDIVKDHLTDIELTAFVISNYGTMNMKEVAALTRAMRDTGNILNLRSTKKKIVDFHSIGGVPGNRTTPIISSILLAAGLIVPKTSTRAITSPAGTADTMEVLCNVSLTLSQLKKVVMKAGGFVTWGGAVNLAPADDKIIRIERPLRIDAEGQMLASIMAKKASVMPTHLLIELPIGQGSKVRDKKHSRHLEKRFQQLGKLLGIRVTVMVEDGSQPIGKGIGPVLEMRDILHVLMNHKEGPEDLRKKSIRMAGRILEFTKKSRKGSGITMATTLLTTGKALASFKKMVEAQQGKMILPEKLVAGPKKYVVKAIKSGRISHIDNHSLAHMARLAGAPRDKKAGIDLYVHRHHKVTKGQALMTIYAENDTELKFAVDAWKKDDGITIK